MARLLKAALAALTAAVACEAMLADTIITRSADIIECTVMHINDSRLQYRRADEGFNREISLAEIFKIKYSDGSEELFNDAQPKPKATQAAGSGATATEPDWASLQPASRTYSIGDWYCENGLEGIVIWTTPDGRHGRLLHPRMFNNSKFAMPAAFFTGPTSLAMGMTDTANGHANLLALRRFMDAYPQYTPDMFPVQRIIDQLGGEWYLPSIEELKYLDTLADTEVIHDGKRTKWHKVINRVSKAHGGDKHGSYYLLSSTETYAAGTGNATIATLYGDPQTPQYCLLKLESADQQYTRPIVRNRGLIPICAFHLF